MKKALISFFMSLLLIGCSKDDDTPFSPEALIGSWNVVETIFPPDDYSEDATGQYETKTYTSGSFIYTFNEYAKLSIFRHTDGFTSTNEVSYHTFLNTLTIQYNENYIVSWNVEFFDGSTLKLHRQDWVFTSDDDDAMKVWCEWWITLKRRM